MGHLLGILLLLKMTIYINSDEIPQVVPKEGYEFVGWKMKILMDIEVTNDKEFLAQYRQLPVDTDPPAPILAEALWLWLTALFAGIGCLRWLWRALLFCCYCCY
ncbi:MAG: hypothetical protein IPF46_06795 [Saprospiraceae bacterium]|nr:hypothetical protein [Candidatus Vicinibacter affinis]